MINIFQKSGNTVTVIGRDKDNKRTMEEISIVPYYYIKELKGEFKDLYGNALKKIECKDMWQLREKSKNQETFEADVQLTDRVLIDKISKIEKSNLRILYFDIETLDNADPDEVGSPITCICCYDNYLKRKFGFVWRKDLKEEVIKDDNKKVFYFNNEESMIKKFINFVVALDFDLLAGWFVEGFDIPYIVNRCIKLGIKDVNNLSMYKDVSVKKNRLGTYYISMNGRYVFDLLKAYKHLTSHQMDSYKLGDVGQIEVGEGKVEHKENFVELWNNIPKLLEYCFKDVMLCVMLDEKRKLIEYHDEIRRLVGCRWECIWNATLLHDILFLRKAKELGVVLPTKVKAERNKYGGGFVDTPIAGLHKNICVIDVVSLYPNIIRSFNLSPETLGKGDINVNGLKFDETKRGICSIICDDVLTLRADVNNRMKAEKKKNGKTALFYLLETQKWALKIVVNSLYGALGTPYFRMYNRAIADTITFMARETNLWCRNVVSNMGLKVVYADTDSVFFKFPDDLKVENYDKFGVDIATKVTNSFTDFVKQYGVKKPHTLVIELDKIYTKMFFGASLSGASVKKRYACFKLEDGKEVLDIKGFETVRSDASVVEKEALTNVFKMILNGKNKEEIERFINSVKLDITTMKYKWSDIAIRRGIKKTTRKDIYTKAMDYSNKYLGTNFKKGDRIKMLFVNNPLTATLAFEFDEQVPKDTKVNWSLMFKRMFDTKLQRIYTALNWNISNEKQVKLFE